MNKIALITGANSGVGFATAKELAALNFDLILLVRSAQKATSTKEAILKQFPNTKIDFEIADLEDIRSVIKAAENIKSRYSKIDRIINNAGYSPSAIEYTKEGYEKSFIANHLGHFVLTTSLLNLVEASGEGRIISVSSGAYVLGKINRMFRKNNRDLNTIKAYGDGKLANILFTKALSEKMAGKPVLAFSLHPGVVASNFGGDFKGINKLMVTLMRPFMISPDKGAKTSIFLATTSLENIQSHNGEYFNKSKVSTTNHKDITDENIKQFWQKSLEAMEEINSTK
jgi:retinol dehydrogenase 12